MRALRTVCDDSRANAPTHCRADTIANTVADESRHDEANQLSNTCAHAVADAADASPDVLAGADASPYTMQRAMRRRFSMPASFN